MMYADRPWLEHYPAEVAPTYDYPKHNIGLILEHTAAKFPHQPAFDFMGYEMCYEQLSEQARKFASGLLELGVIRGDRVAIMLPNCPQMLIAYYGTLLMGGVVVMTNPLYQEGELTHQMRDSDAVVMVTLDILLNKVLQVKKHTSIMHVVVGSIADYLPFPKGWLYRLKARKDGQQLHIPELPYVYRMEKWLKKQTSSLSYAEVDAEQDIAMLQYTGGTTGVAKGVMLTHKNLLSNTVQSSKWFYRSKLGQEVFLAALPCFHVFGLTVLLNQSVYLGGQLILMPRFDVKQVLTNIHRKKATIFPGAPTMYIAINHAKDATKYDLSSIRACVSGSASLPVEVQETFEGLTGGRLIEGYGLTESSPITHANNIWGYRKIGSVGIPFPDTEAAIVNSETGERLAVGEIGELIVRGPQVMKGYWNRPEETASVLKEGWLYTGDMGRMDEEGFFYIVDRKKDLINASGFKVYPRDVEEALFEHPDVKEAVVIGVPDPYRGETVKAFIVLKEDSSVTKEQMITWCRNKLAAFKVPRIIEFRTELPKTMIGKVLRRKLIEEELEKNTKDSSG